MHIPSYDDLTPSIPDVSPGEVFTSVKELLHGARDTQRIVRADSTWAASGVPSALFAALHGDAARTFSIARDFSPRLERHGSGGSGDVVLDVAGLGGLIGDAHAIGAELARAGAARVAVAKAQIAARLLARTRLGLTVVDASPADALADVPLIVLRQLLADDHGVVDGRAPAKAARHRHWPAWPACDQIFDILQRWGLSTLGEFAALPAGNLSARLGQDGLTLQQLARGIDGAPLVPDPGVPRFVETMELEWPVDALEPLSFVFARLLDPLAATLERADRGAAAIRVDLRLVDRSTHSRMLQLPAAMRDPRVLRTLLLLDLESHPPSAAVDVVSIEADPAPSRIVQYSLLERALPSAETLATLNARLGALVGDSRCGSPVLLDTHRPDGFVVKRFREGSEKVQKGSERVQKGSEKVQKGSEKVQGSERVQQQGSRPCMRRFRPPVAVRVTVDRGRPVHLAIDRQRMPGGRIERAAGPWRASGDWWTAERWNREEWDVAFDEGTLCRLFRDRDSGVWFVDGVID